MKKLLGSDTSVSTGLISPAIVPPTAPLQPTDAARPGADTRASGYLNGEAWSEGALFALGLLLMASVPTLWLWAMVRLAGIVLDASMGGVEETVLLSSRF